MLFWLWKIYIAFLSSLCATGLTRISTPNDMVDWGGCWPWNAEPWNTRTFLRYLLWAPEYSEYERMVLVDIDFVLRLHYTWGNATLLVPDPQSSEWKDLRFREEDLAVNCVDYPAKCPRIPKFLSHHLIEGDFQQEKKRKTQAGDKVWWSEVAGQRYLYPGAIKILKREEAWNGELWEIERPLWLG
jgi:hypothetical protein